MTSDNTYAVNSGWGLIMSDAGISTAHVLRRAGLPGDLLTSGVKKISADQYFALWTAVEDEVGDPNLPLLVARVLTLEAFDPPLFAASCSRNLNVAARRIAQHKRLIGPMRISVTQSEIETTLELIWPHDAQPPYALSMTDLVFWVAFARLATRHPIRPVRVTTPTPPEDQKAYMEYLGVMVEEDPGFTVVFSAQDAARPFLTANDRMWDFFEPELGRRLSELEAGTSVGERVRASLLELLPAGDASMETVAHELAMSTRTLQRRLRGEGTSFQEMLNATRESLARHYLENSDMSAGEISFLLGYDDPRSFYRAFQAWTGQTPQVARAAAG